jgi:hypothetical protein
LLETMLKDKLSNIMIFNRQCRRLLYDFKMNVRITVSNICPI